MAAHSILDSHIHTVQYISRGSSRFTRVWCTVCGHDDWQACEVKKNPKFREKLGSEWVSQAPARIFFFCGNFVFFVCFFVVLHVSMILSTSQDPLGLSASFKYLCYEELFMVWLSRANPRPTPLWFGCPRLGSTTQIIMVWLSIDNPRPKSLWFCCPGLGFTTHTFMVWLSMARIHDAHLYGVAVQG